MQTLVCDLLVSDCLGIWESACVIGSEDGHLAKEMPASAVPAAHGHAPRLCDGMWFSES